MPTAGQSGNQPDFAAIYGDYDILTPHLAAHLWGAALFLSDTYREDPHSEVLRQELPPVAQRLADEAWIERFVSCFETVADRLGTGRFVPEQLASCTAEEMALHMVIDLAEAFAADGIVPIESELPRRSDADTDFDSAREILFRDHDVLMLFNVSLDGTRTAPASSPSSTASPTSTRGTGSTPSPM